MGRGTKANKFPRAAQVQRANNALFSYGLDSGSSSEPESPPPPAVPSSPASLSPAPEEDDDNLDRATIESATKTILAEFAFEEGKKIFNSEEAGDRVFIQIFTAAFLDTDAETGKKTWRLDTDILGVLANACREPGALENVHLIEDLETGCQYLSGKTEASALESIRTFALNCARDQLPSLPEQPEFTEDPLHESVQTFVYLGLIAIRAFVRGKHLLNSSLNPLRLFENARASNMAEEPNLFMFGEMGQIYDPQAIALEKQKKKARKRAAKKAAKAKEDERNNTQVAEGDTAGEASSSGPANATTASNEAAPAHIARASDEAAVTDHPPASSQAAITNPAPALTPPSGLAHDDPLTTMEMATQALSMYGARPPAGLSQYLGTPIRPRAARSATARNTEPRNLADASSVAEGADVPPPPRRPRRDGRRRPAPSALTSNAAAAGAGAAAGTEDVTDDIMQPLPASQRHGRNETIEEYQRRTAPPVAPAPTEYRVHPLNNEQFVITGVGPQSFTAAVRDIAGAVTSGVSADDPTAIARTMMSAHASLPASAVTPDADEPDFASIARAIMSGQAPPPRGAFLGPSNISAEDIRDAMALVDDSNAGAHTTSRAVAGPSRLPVQPRQTTAPHHLPDVPRPTAASRLPAQPRQTAASRRQGPPRQTAASRRAMQRLYDEIEAELDAAQGLDPVARRAAFAQAQQRLLRSETLAAARREMPLRPTATAATQAALQEGRDDALNAVEEQRRAEQAGATRTRPTPCPTGNDTINARAREQGYSFDIGGMPGWLGELERMQIQGLRDERVAEENERRLAERMRVVRERRAAAVEDILERSAQIDREAEEESHRAMAAAEEREKKETEGRDAARKAADEAKKAADEAKKAEKKAKIAAKRAERKAKK
ncbi:hypothetical protein G647_05991 [Cladophialophora carrionii CBS 160.54]|uniref:Uncharacterized protein n=1 Tax=Cladophialophora carrionii CBS 160.54 TaxID=1279043 RepID=V9D5K7_9EURO|nr:uncharacterized protein G647_05991 [Cladophialophora carrionii CBS 160.54]ETI21921.1 hypothetical protein G647_05991 [Cladophialophora carrionii CBS 160.54]